MEILLVAIVVAVLVVGAVALVATRRRRGELLEPPPTTPAAKGAGPAVKSAEPAVEEAAPAVGDVGPPIEEAHAEPASGPSVLEAPKPAPRLRERLGKARSALAGYMGALAGRAKIDEGAWEELEEALIRADVGVAATTDLMSRLRARVAEEKLVDGDQLLAALRDTLKTDLGGADRSLSTAGEPPSVWLFVGVNGVGKTTTIGKVGQHEVGEGRKVVMAAGDTFRAAATEQLEIWAERVGADLVKGDEGADPSAVVFDAVEAAAARGADLVLADTAGRLHTKVNLMEELAKVRRVAGKGAGTVTEVLLVIDATTGQNGLTQARQFAEATEVTGVVLTKLDGSAKGGIVVAIQSDLGLPVKLVGVGESAEDLVPFDADEFVDALLP